LLFVGAAYSLLAAAMAATGAHDTPLNPEDPAYMRRQYVWFQAQDQRRQQQIRKLHADFQQLDPDAQARYTRVLQNYNAWLTRLPQNDRDRVFSAPSAKARLEVIRELREREWVAALPKPYRDEYTQLDDDARRQRVQDWRNEESESNDMWAIAQQHWAEGTGRFQPMSQPDGKMLIDAYVSHLRENLTEVERRVLDEAKTDTEVHGNYIGYVLLIARLSERHPIFPGRVGPKDWTSLPPEVKEYLRANDKHFKNQDRIPKVEELKELRRAQGRWPDFAVELTRYCQKNNLTLPVPLGDCRKDQMPPEFDNFFRMLEPGKGRPDAAARAADLDKLNMAQGSWPEYPRLIVELAYKYQIRVPGWTLPGWPQAWEKFRAGKSKIK
jgi:hypothetical protein